MKKKMWKNEKKRATAIYVPAPIIIKWSNENQPLSLSSSSSSTSSSLYSLDSSHTRLPYTLFIYFGYAMISSNFKSYLTQSRIFDSSSFFFPVLPFLLFYFCEFTIICWNLILCDRFRFLFHSKFKFFFRCLKSCNFSIAKYLLRFRCFVSK